MFLGVNLLASMLHVFISRTLSVPEVLVRPTTIIIITDDDRMIMKERLQQFQLVQNGVIVVVSVQHDKVTLEPKLAELGQER